MTFNVFGEPRMEGLQDQINDYIDLNLPRIVLERLDEVKTIIAERESEQQSKEDERE